MEGLTEGRIVHFVPSGGFNNHRAAVITHIWSKEGVVNLYIFPDGSFEIDPLTPTSVRYSDSHEPFSWHWIEKA